MLNGDKNVPELAKVLSNGVAWKLLKREIDCRCHLNLSLNNCRINVLAGFLNDVNSQELSRLIEAQLVNVSVNLMRPEKVKIHQAGDSVISECVRVELSLAKGRYCVASRDVEAGECLFVEKAYCAILLPEFNESFCQECLRQIYDVDKSGSFVFTNIEACDECTSVLYCSLECKLKDREKHAFECKMLKSLLHNLGIAHLAYRILASTEFALALKYAKMSSAEVETNLSSLDYKNSTDYEQIFHLLTHEKVIFKQLFDLLFSVNI